MILFYIFQVTGILVTEVLNKTECKTNRKNINSTIQGNHGEYFRINLSFSDIYIYTIELI